MFDTINARPHLLRDDFAFGENGFVAAGRLKEGPDIGGCRHEAAPTIAPEA
ncbi:hypothetical protein [Bradyrhizobium sp. LTSPM299]|uniref:hypothetical protein n=1 Tax=Bradyrhizobium sp. LTSPM299 TaxID=1619233 RepID=UPI000AEA4400|nr:hypothetical protein [Bradyrhizobium sp. LTSPM299]